MDNNLNMENVDKKEQQAATPTLKLLQNKTHIGPVSIGGATLASLTKAAGKIAFDSNLKITIKESGDEVGKVTDPTKKPVVVKIDLTKGREQSEAILYILAWDRLFHEVGSPGYQKKYQEFAQAQASVYAEIGLNVGPTDAKPELTEQQRRMYNDRMRKYAFSYYEYRLSFKQPGVKAVRSLTYRTVKPLDLSSVVTRLDTTAKGLDNKLTIKARG